MAVGHVFFHLGKVASGDDLGPIILFAGVAAMSVMQRVEFQRKQAG